MVPCQDSLLPTSFPRRGQHVRCLCRFKHSLMPSFFLCAFHKKRPLCSSLWLTIAQPIILASRPPGICPVSCWLHMCSRVIITSAKAATAALRYIIFQLQTSGPLLRPVINWPRFLYWFAAAKNLGTGAQFFPPGTLQIGPVLENMVQPDRTQNGL